jgi:hypothetical protein
VLSSGSSLEVESVLSEGVNLSHGQLTLDDEVERPDLGNTGRGSSAPVSAGSSHGVLARLKRVLSPEGVEVLLGSSALGEIELVVSHGVLESDLHDVIMDGLADGLGLEESSSLGNGLTGSLGGSSKLGSDGTVSVSSSDVSLSETESGITYGTSGHSLGVGGELGKSDGLSDGTGNLSSGLTDSEVVGSDVLSVGNLGADSSSDGSSHSELTESNVSRDPFVESDLLVSKSLLGLGFGNTSGCNSSSDGSLGEEKSFLDSEVEVVSFSVGVDGGAENGMSVNSSFDGKSEVVFSNRASLDGDSEFVDSSLPGGSSFTGNTLVLAQKVTDKVGVLAGFFGVNPHGSGTDNPFLGEDNHSLGHDGGVSGSLLVVDVEFVSASADHEHLVSPSQGVSHLDLSVLGKSLGVDASLKSDLGTVDSFTHSLLGGDGVVVSDLGLLDLNVLEVDGDLEGSSSSLGISLGLDLEVVHSHGRVSGFDEKSGLVSKDSEVHGELSLLMVDESHPFVHSLFVEDESDVESESVLLGGGRFPESVNSVVVSLVVLVLVDGVLDSSSDGDSSSLVGEVLGMEGLVSGNVVSPGFDGEVSDVDGSLGESVGTMVLLPGSGGEFLLHNNLSSERGGGNSSGSGNLIEEVSSGVLSLGVLEILGGNSSGMDSDGIVLSVLGLGNNRVAVGLVGGSNESLGVSVVVISTVSEVLGLDVGGVLSFARFVGGQVSLDHEVVLSGDEEHGFLDNSLAVSNGDHHLLDGVVHLLDVSVASSPFTSGLAVSLFGKSEEVESKLLFLSVSVVSGNLSVDVDLGSLLSGDTDGVLSLGKSVGSLGSFGEDLSSGFHSGSGGVVSSGFEDSSVLSGNSLFVDDNPVESHLVFTSGVSDVLSSGVHGDESESLPVGLFGLVESDGGVVLLDHSDVVLNHLSESDNLKSENVSLLLGNEHGSVVSGIFGLGLNSHGNSFHGHSVGIDSSADSVLGHLGPLHVETVRDLGVLDVSDSDAVVLEGKVVSSEGSVSGDLNHSPEVLGKDNGSSGLVDVDLVDGSVVIVLLVKLGNGALVPVDPLVVVCSGSSDLENNSVDLGLAVFGDVGDHFLVRDNESVEDHLGVSDHLSVLNLNRVDHSHDVSDSDVSSLGHADPVESGMVSLSPFAVGNVSGVTSFLGEASVVDGILKGSTGKFDKGEVSGLEDLGLGDSNSGSSVVNSDVLVCDSGVVSILGSGVVEVKGSLFSESSVSDGEVVLSLVEGSKAHGALGSNLSLKPCLLGSDSSVDGASLVRLSLSLHSSLDLDLSGVHSLSDLASSDRVLGADNSGSGGSNVDTGLSVLDGLLVNSFRGSGLGKSLELSGVSGTASSSNSSELGVVSASELVNLAESFVNGSGSGLGSKGSGDLGVLDGDKLSSSGETGTGVLSNSVSVSVFGSLLGSDLEESLSSGFSLLADLLLEEDRGLHVSADSPSLFKDDLSFGTHLTLEEDFSSEGSVSLGNEVRGGLASLLLLELLLLSLLSESGNSLLTDVVGLGRAEPVVPLHSVPESTTIFASTEVVGLVLVPVLESKEGTVGPHPLALLEEIVSTNPNGGFSVNDGFDLILFSSSSDGGEMSSPLSAGFLGIGPVKFGVGDVFESGLGGSSLADEFALKVASIIGPLTGLSVHGDTVGGVGTRSLGRLASSPVGELVGFVGRPHEFSLGLKVVSTDPGGTSVRSDRFVDGVVLASTLNGSEVSSPFKAELSRVGPGSLEVVKGVLLFSVGEGLGRLPGRRSGGGSNLSLTDVGGSGVTVSVVPLASGVGSVDLSASFGFSRSSEPVPFHGVAVSPFPVVLGSFTTDPSSSDSVGSTADLVLSNKSVSGSLLGPRVNGREVTTPRSANVSGVFPGLLISSEEEFELSILVLEVFGSLANVRHLMVASEIVPSVSSKGFLEGTAHFFLVLVDFLGLSRSPEFPATESVGAGVVRPVPGSLKVEGVSSHPGKVVVSNSLGDIALFTVVLNGSKLSTELRGTGRSSFGPGLLGGEVFVFESVVNFVEGLAGGSGVDGVPLASSAHELSLDIASVLSERSFTVLSREGTAILIAGSGVVNLPAVSEPLHLGGLLVGPSPSVGVFEIVVTNPDVGSGNLLHSLGHGSLFEIRFSEGKLTTGFTAVVSSGVPVVGLFGDPPSIGVSLDLIGLLVSTSALGPPDRSGFLRVNDSSSLSDGNVVAGVRVRDLFPGVVGLRLVNSAISGGGNKGSFGTDSDISAAGHAFKSHPSAVTLLVDFTISTADNGVTVGINSNSGSFRSNNGTMSVFVGLSTDSGVGDVVSVDSNISDLLVSSDMFPFVGVESHELSGSGNNPRVAHVSDSNSGSLDVVAELSPVVHGETMELSVSVSHDLTVLGDDNGDSVGVSGNINGVHASAEFGVEHSVVLAHVFVVRVGANDLDDLVISADEGSLLFAVKVLPSTVLLEGEAISSSGGFVNSPVSEREVSVVVRPSPDLVLSSLNVVVASTDPDFVSLLDILVFLEGVVLVLSEDRGEVPALFVTVGLSVVPVKGELGGVVPDSLLARLASLVGPASFTVSGDGVRVSVLADSNTVSSLTVDSVPVVSSGVRSLSLDVSPDAHVVVTSGVLSNDHQITGRTGSNVFSSTSELHPLLSMSFVLLRLEDLFVLADNGGLTVVLNSDSVGGTRGVSVDVELALLEESNFTSSVDNPDLSVGTGTDINGSHVVRFPFGIGVSKRSDDSRCGDGEDFALGGDSNSGLLVSAFTHSIGFSADNLTVLVSLVIKSGSEDVLVGIDSDIRNTVASVLPGDVIFLLAHLSSTDTVVVVREDSSGARVVDKSHGGGGMLVGLSGKTDEGLGALVEVLVDMAVLTASVSDDDGLTTVESDLETSGDLFVSEVVPEVLDVGNLTFGLLGDLDGLASHELSVGDGSSV